MGEQIRPVCGVSGNHGDGATDGKGQEIRGAIKRDVPTDPEAGVWHCNIGLSRVSKEENDDEDHFGFCRWKGSW